MRHANSDYSASWSDDRSNHLPGDNLPAAGELTPLTWAKPPRNIAFVDTALASIDTLIQSLEDTQVVLIDSRENGVAQITKALANYENLSAVHIFSHGSDGLLQLGNTLLSHQSVASYGESLQQWAAALSAEADLMIYGCNLVAGEAGNQLVNRIAQLTGADVAASDDLTGKDGDWQLEFSTGDIESEIALATSALSEYDGNLALLTNGDFEQGLTGWKSLRSPASLSTDAFSGSASLEITGSSKGAKQVVDAAPDEVYRFTGSAKTTSSGRSIVDLKFFDQNFQRVGNVVSQQITSSSWDSFSIETTAPSNARFVQARAYRTENDGSFFIDNLTLEGATVAPPPPPTSGEELLSNPGFESGLAGWKTATGTETTSSDAFSGSQSLLLSAAGSGTRQTISAVAGERYKISGYGKTDSSSYVGFRFKFLDANNKKIGGNISTRITSNDWQLYEAEAVAPPGTRSIFVWTYKAKASGEAYIDQLSLSAGGTTPPPPTDTAAPTATLSASNVTDAASSYDFTVTYSDSTAVDTSSIDNGDIRVSGPGGFSQAATLVSVNNNSDGSPRTATYRMTPPGGSWDTSDNGSYAIALNNNQVQDTLGNATAGTNLGSFSVGIAASGEPSLIGLEDSTISVNESSGSATITVLRNGGSNGVLTVDYSTVAGSATENVDYTPTAGTLTFADGETQKSVAVAILNDNTPEEQEAFGFAIDNVTGNGTLGAPRTAQISIADDDGFTYNGNQYVLTNGAKTWEQAQAEASSLGGNLVTINAAAEEAWLQQTFGENEGFWIGLNDVSTEGQFEWASGEPVAYTNWAPGEPNDGGFATSQDYGWMNFGSTKQWDDNTAGATLRGIVEIGDFNGPPGGQGNGLKGEYYNNTNFTDLAVTRTDATVDFDWEFGSPASNIASDTFSVRWTGKVEPLYSETYTFQTTSDDGVRLWVNNQLIIDEYRDQGATAYSGNITLNAGQQYDIRMEYYENGGAALAELAWSSASQPLQIIPRSQLYSDPVDSRTLTRQTVISGLSFPTSIDWLTDGSDRLLVAEQGGVVKLYENGNVQSTPFIDISAQVNGVRDRGLLDIAVHPNFASNPYVYLLFTYDPPEVYSYSGGAGPDGQNNRASRLVRVTADANNNYRTAVPGSEVVLLGKNSTWENFNGFANSTFDLAEPPAGILPDGSNLQDFLNSDSESHTIGSVEFGPDGALYVSNGDGTSYNRVDRRSSRVQDIDNLSGKILRIDPITGRGLSSNPFFNGNPDANRSKVYQLGLRNPFRITVNPQDGQVFVGDVGWTVWEEINAAGPGANFGWPYYEGANGVSAQTGGYSGLPEAQAFYNSGTTVTPSIYALNHETDGINAIVMGDVYTGDAYPDRYKGDLFFGDLGQGIIRNISFDGSGNISNIETFDIEDPYVVQMAEGPDDQLYYVNQLNGTVKRWVFS
ncbi:MAG: DUF4347 domain-containing protein [Cyanobacteria bacterium J06626_6]